MLVDSHCHLDFEVFDKDRDEVVARAKDVLIVNSTVDPHLVGKALPMQERYDNVYCMIGVSASECDEEVFDRMVELIREHKDKIVGLGEAGLDYHWVKDERGRQVERAHFLRVIDLAKELGLPLLVHSRDAESDSIGILEEAGAKAIMHCFSGTVEEARRAADLGCLISIPANIAYSKGRQKLAAAMPLESLVVETDAPYLAPVRGERNEPANVKAACGKIAKLKGLSQSAVEDATARNALRFLRIKA
jgi:TatD DNase family protein